jgi:hypothetical protein
MALEHWVEFIMGLRYSCHKTIHYRVYLFVANPCHLAGLEQVI